MTVGRDPNLEALFVEASQDLPGESFTGQVMKATGSVNNRVRIRRYLIGVTLAICGWLLAAPLEYATLLITHSLALPVIDIDILWLAQLLLPVNNIASLIALGVTAIRLAYKKLFS